MGRDKDNLVTKRPSSTISSTDLNHLCRLCLSTINANEREVVFECHQVPKLSEKILCVFGIQTTNWKNWPSKICTKCLENTEQCYNHRKKYKLIEKSLHDMLKNRAVEIKKKPMKDYVDTLANSSTSCVLKNFNSMENENYDQQGGSKVNTILTFPDIVNHNGQSCTTEVFVESDFQKQVVSDDTISTNEEEVSNCTPTKIQSNYPNVIVRPAYQQPDLQQIGQVFKNPNYNVTESETHPQLMDGEEMDDYQDEFNALIDPEDRISVLLFAAGIINREKNKKQVLSDEKGKIKDTQTTALKNHKPSAIKKQLHELHKVRQSPIKKKCTNCGIEKSASWRRIGDNVVCNACGLYFNLHGRKRPMMMRRDTVFTRKRKSKMKQLWKKYFY